MSESKMSLIYIYYVFILRYLYKYLCSSRYNFIKLERYLVFLRLLVYKAKQ